MTFETFDQRDEEMRPDLPTYLARTVNAVQYHNKSRFSIVSIIISVSNVTSPYDRSYRLFSNGGT